MLFNQKLMQLSYGGFNDKDIKFLQSLCCEDIFPSKNLMSSY